MVHPIASRGSILLGDYLICVRCHTIVPTSEEGTGLNNGLFCYSIKKNHRCKPRTFFRAPVREMKRRLLSCFFGRDTDKKSSQPRKNISVGGGYM